METEVFKAVCPLEIGDTVAIGAGKTVAGVRTAYYLPAGNNALSEKRQNSIQI